MVGAGPGALRFAPREKDQAMSAGEEPTPLRPPRARTPRDDLWDCIAEHFGAPRTKTEQTQFGKVIGELLAAGATIEETANACIYVLRNFDSPSVFSLPKWFSIAQTNRTSLSPQQQAIQQLKERG